MDVGYAKCGVNTNRLIKKNWKNKVLRFANQVICTWPIINFYNIGRLDISAGYMGASRHVNNLIFESINIQVNYHTC